MATLVENSPPPAKPSNGLQGEIVGDSPAMVALRDWLRRVASSSLPVLIRGETGSGKETVAAALHRHGPRREGPFVAVNCTALSESLLDAELFGSARGAYTGAHRDRPGLFRVAHRGTLLLDEVGDTGPAMQAKLLRAIQEGKVRPVGDDREIDVDVRFLAATHRDLRQMVAAGLFRADLYHRLAVLEVRVPPLRERLPDLDLLVEALSPRLEAETGHGRPVIADSAWQALAAYAWPGNVRELHSVLARAMLRAAGGPIRASHLGFAPSAAGPSREALRRAGRLEREMIEAALRGAEGNVSAAARRIGWTRQKLYRRIKALQVPRGAGVSS